MYIYSISVYAISITACILTILSFLRLAGIFNAGYIIRILIIICVPIISITPLPTYSIADILYSLFDIPSFLLAIISVLSMFRSLVDSIGFTISYRGFVTLFIIWLLLICNDIGLCSWSYGFIGYKILVSGIFISIMYCIDRLCAIMLTISLLLWIIFHDYMDVYNAMFDPLVCICGICIQRLPIKRGNFHVATLRPKPK